jgi:hypothetical protein
LNKINKPLHFLFAGAAVVLFAPPEFKFKWAGYILLALGLAGSVEWVTSQFHKWWTDRKQLEKLRQSIATLNNDEKSVCRRKSKRVSRRFI